MTIVVRRGKAGLAVADDRREEDRRRRTGAAGRLGLLVLGCSLASAGEILAQPTAQPEATAVARPTETAPTGALIDRIAFVMGDDIITSQEIDELRDYLRWKRDTAKTETARATDGDLLREANEEAITRHLVLQKLKADPDLRLARSRARREVSETLRTAADADLEQQLRGYGLSLERYTEIEALTIAIQNYVRDKLRFAIVPTAAQIQQTIDRHPELKQQFDRLSDEGKDRIRAAIGRQLEFQNFLEQYKKFVDELRVEVEIIQVGAAEEG